MDGFDILILVLGIVTGGIIFYFVRFRRLIDSENV